MNLNKLALFSILLLPALSQGQNKYIDTTFEVRKLSFQVKVTTLKEGFDRLTVFRSGHQILSDTIASALDSVRMVDYDFDGRTDLLLFYSNELFTNELYLFDKRKKTFRAVKNFGTFPDATGIKDNPKFYFSYRNVGCDDRTWESYLFKLEKFSAVPVGLIYGQDCEGELRNIDFFRIIGGDFNNKKHYLALPHIPTVEQYSQRWPFIEKYWNNSFKSFR